MIVPSAVVSRFMVNSTACRCLHIPPVSSWSGQEQYGVSGSGQTVYRPRPLWDGTSQTLPFWVSFCVAAITKPRCCRGSIEMLLYSCLYSIDERAELVNEL